MDTFRSLSNLPAPLIDNLEDLGYTDMTPIQTAVLSLLLEGKDIIAQAKTGSGKTLAFGIPIIHKIDIVSLKPQALILSPTRELALQVAQQLRNIAKYKNNLKIITLYGGTPLRPQSESLASGAHILIATPGRLQDHLSRGNIDVNSIEMLVLDEADKMLDMGFYDAIIKIVSNLPKKRQSMLFSATYPGNIQKLSEAILVEPKFIKKDTLHLEATITQLAYEVSKESKDTRLIGLLQAYKPSNALIFCNQKVTVVALTEHLQSQGFDAIDIQGDLDQRERNEAIICFANASSRILVATDVASRGLDIKNVALVVNYDFPQNDETYTHRIGRTARAGATGTAITLYEPQHKAKLSALCSAIDPKEFDELLSDREYTMRAANFTLYIEGGKKDRLRAGDILGALSKDIRTPSGAVGKIDILDTTAYVAIALSAQNKITKNLKRIKIKGKNFRVWRI